MDGQQQHAGSLKRGLENRHIQLIALGGAIGTGLFLGSAGVLKSAGPSMILGYAIAGFIAFLIMRQLGEMIVEEPVAGSFSHFAHKYWGGYAGFLAGWNYWVLYVLVGMAELTAVGKYIQFWWPDVPTWVTAAVFFVLINVINLANVRVFGETEFWFALIKVVAIIGMIILGLYLLVSGTGGEQAAVSNLWSHGGFFPNGLEGLVMVLAIIMFSFGGLELVGITAAEASEPKKVIPKAINQVIYRILIFYIGALSVLLMLYPWDKLLETLNAAGDPYSGSPFVQIFSLIGSDTAAHLLNFVVLTAALSVYNSGVYCNSRMLYGLAEQGDAPKALLKVNRRGVPVLAIGVSALITLLCVLVNYLAPKQALELLMALVVAALVINWAMISLSHLMFRKSLQRQGIEPFFKSLWYPFSNYLCLAFVALILGVMLLIPGINVSVYAIPFWLAFIAVCYWIRRSTGARR
ncbi:aromatic amino acid:proton symporter (AAT family) [Pseudomonas sp. SLBN-26]|uniref:Aromatic amino acid transporter AroP n=1 Tax=Metapseudomonas otitidis TaxID=319939 RepID=A0A679GAW9_9GAMM|nr:MULTISPECIES: amino acid permease [Pseudomonas]MCO7555284.1 amino acid permease [Pseudomonas otitidis]MCP1617669.1 aromatic amino acid transport protein AroP [Pseudomonas otitidis]MDU9399141.1 amino acid permease [Pseudomonas sp. zfem003]TQL06909.1 aromatic amino acid:proton symporter (AAT family) [Pseudomonas sp. SLBN-26]BCA27766.1 aromatic amino acid transporter AroP [Pseudomonas otitidis]